MNARYILKYFAWSVLFFTSCHSILAQAAPNLAVGEKSPDITKNIGIDQKLGDYIPTDLKFFDEEGKEHVLGEYFSSKPVVLVPVFYNCSSACLITLEESIKSFVKLHKAKFRLGKDYEIVTFSIHPKETPELAKVKKNLQLREYKKKVKDFHADSFAPYLHYLTGPPDSIKKLTNAIGFKYVYDPEKDDIQHAAGIMILTPKGRISKYFYGVQFEPKLLRDALIQAGKEDIGQKSEPLLFGCLQVDPVTKKLSMNILQTLKVLAFLTLVSLTFAIVFMSVRNKNKKMDGVGGK